MGNCYCCKDKKKNKINLDDSNNIPDPKDFKFNLSGINILIKAGDITKEKADAIVSGTDNYVKNRSESFLNEQTIEGLNRAVIEKRGINEEQPLQNGEVIITERVAFKKVKKVIHIIVPLWRGGKFDEVEQLKQGFSNILKEATKAKIRSIIFTDVAGSLFGIPKQHTAKVLMEVIHDYALNYKSPNKIKKLKFIHKEPQTVLIFQDYLKQEVLYKSQESKLDYIDHKQQYKGLPDEKENINEIPIDKDSETKQSTNNTPT